MSLGGSHPRIETEPKRGRKGVREAALLVFRHPTEALRTCEDQVYRDDWRWDRKCLQAQSRCPWLAERRRTQAVLLGVCAPPSPLGMFLVCVVKWMSLSEDSDSGLFPFKVRMAATRPILFSGLFCFVSLSWINTHRKRGWFIFLEKQDIVKHCKWQRSRHAHIQ